MISIFRNANLIDKKIVLGIGVFDGVHIGHQKVLENLTALAEESSAIPVAMTFDPHPKTVLGHGDPQLLVPLEERIRLLKQYGACEVVVINFTREFAQLPPVAFLNHLLNIPAKLCGICVGSEWRFGAKGAGDTKSLQNYASENDLTLIAVQELTVDGKIVSSSSIRRAIAAGRLDEAQKFLGRNYRLCGIVEHGNNIASTKLECPTANIKIKDGVLPPDGVYAALAITEEGQSYPAAINVGIAPTYGLGKMKRRVEAHLLDYTGNLYGHKLGVEFLEYLRSERTYPNEEALKNQIKSDVATIRQILEEQNGKK